MTRRAIALIAGCLVLGTLLPAQGAPARSKGAPYSVPLKVLDAALDCTSGSGSPQSEPVLLVHGTGVNRELNWEWNYWKALPQAGFDTCWVQLPKSALFDIQISAEYVARAVEVMHKTYDSKIDVLGHSQGGLSPRWAIKWFASGRFVNDYVGLASPNHGTAAAGSSSPCFESCWQMRMTSNFIEALNKGDETPGATDYTNIYTAADQLVQPVGTQALEGGHNVLLQDLCPGRPVDHLGIVGDGVTYDIVLQALTSAELELPKAIDCTKTTMEGASYPPPGTFPPDYSENSFTSEEPPLKPYAR